MALKKLFEEGNLEYFRCHIIAALTPIKPLWASRIIAEMLCGRSGAVVNRIPTREYMQSLLMDHNDQCRAWARSEWCYLTSAHMRTIMIHLKKTQYQVKSKTTCKN